MKVDDDITSCEWCDKELPFDAAVRTADGCYLCPECVAEWRAEFDQCSHEWEPHRDDMGDLGRHCRKCHGFVVDEIESARAAIAKAGG